jgi:hypothetical protein
VTSSRKTKNLRTKNLRAQPVRGNSSERGSLAAGRDFGRDVSHCIAQWGLELKQAVEETLRLRGGVPHLLPAPTPVERGAHPARRRERGQLIVCVPTGGRGEAFRTILVSCSCRKHLCCMFHDGLQSRAVGGGRWRRGGGRQRHGRRNGRPIERRRERRAWPGRHNGRPVLRPTRRSHRLGRRPGRLGPRVGRCKLRIHPKQAGQEARGSSARARSFVFHGPSHGFRRQLRRRLHHLFAAMGHDYFLARHGVDRFLR